MTDISANAIIFSQSTQKRYSNVEKSNDVLIDLFNPKDCFRISSKKTLIIEPSIFDLTNLKCSMVPKSLS